MTKIAFIGAGSLGFTRGAGARPADLPAAAGRDAVADGHRRGAAGLRRAVGEQDCRHGRLRRAGRGHHGPGGGAGRRRLRADHHPCRRRRCLAARHRDPEAVRGRHQRRRHARAVRHLPRAADDPGDARHRLRHRAAVPECAAPELHQPDGDALPGHAARDADPAHRPLPQRAGHRGDAGALDRRGRRTRSSTPAPASTTWPGTSTTGGTARTRTR